MDTPQRAYAVLAGVALVAAGPNLLLAALIPLERLLVGALLAIEGVLAAALLGSARLVGLLAALALLGTGLYLFVLRKQPET